MAVCFLTPIYTSSEKRPLISDHIKGLLVAAFRSPLMKALDRSVETLGIWIVTSSVTFIKSANQSSIKLCLIVHLVAVWTLIYFTILIILLPKLFTTIQLLNLITELELPTCHMYFSWIKPNSLSSSLKHATVDCVGSYQNKEWPKTT